MANKYLYTCVVNQQHMLHTKQHDLDAQIVHLLYYRLKEHIMQILYGTKERPSRIWL